MTFSHSNTYIPLPEAIRKYGVSRDALLERIKSGKLTAAKLPDGEFLVAESEIDTSLNIKREDFAHLRGRKISMSESSRKYGISQPTFSRWAKLGFIKVLERGWKVYLDEADVAYCAAVYQEKYKLYNGRMMGVSVFDKNGNPYQVKYKEVAANLRKERREKRRTEKVTD